MKWKKVIFYVLFTIFEVVFFYFIMNASYHDFIYRDKNASLGNPDIGKYNGGFYIDADTG